MESQKQLRVETDRLKSQSDPANVSSPHANVVPTPVVDVDGPNPLVTSIKTTTSLPPPSQSPGVNQPSIPVFTGLPSSANLSSSSKQSIGQSGESARKKRSKRLREEGKGFTSHVIRVKTGEDLSLAIIALSMKGPRNVTIISASGTLSSATLRLSGAPNGKKTYEGLYEIMKLSGSFLVDDKNNEKRLGGINVILCSSSDGRVIGGGVAGVLKAASPVEIVLTSFAAEAHKKSKPPTIMDSENLSAHQHLGGDYSRDSSHKIE